MHTRQMAAQGKLKNTQLFIDKNGSTLPLFSEVVVVNPLQGKGEKTMKMHYSIKVKCNLKK